MKQTSNSIDDLYLSAVKDLLDAPQVGDTRELTNVKLVLKDINNNIVSVRDISPSYLFGELLWYFNGDNSLEFISQFSSFWNHLSDDGMTCNSAYGYLITKAYRFNQIEKVIEILKTDPQSRRAKINLNAPNKFVDKTKDEPCTMTLHYIIRDNKLHCTTIMRSNDIWFGFPYDVAFFTELQKYIANRLGLAYGSYTHFAVSFHMYERNSENLEYIAKIAKLPRAMAQKFYNPIIWDRLKFFENLQPLYEIAKHDGKEALMKELDRLGIYKED